MATAAARNASLCIALISVVAEWWGQGERGKKTATPFEKIHVSGVLILNGILLFISIYFILIKTVKKLPVDSAGPSVHRPKLLGYTGLVTGVAANANLSGRLGLDRL